MSDKPKQPEQVGIVIYPRAGAHPIRVDASGPAHANQLAGQLAEAIEHQKRLIDFPGAFGPQYVIPTEVFAFWPTKFIEQPQPADRIAAAQEKIADSIVPPRESWQGGEKS